MSGVACVLGANWIVWCCDTRLSYGVYAYSSSTTRREGYLGCPSRKGLGWKVELNASSGGCRPHCFLFLLLGHTICLKAS